MINDELGPVLRVDVLGQPVGQGNIRHLGAGRPAVHQNAKTLLPWRRTIVAATKKAMAGTGIGEPFDGALYLEARFLMARGKTVRRDMPTVPPDLDHLIRALGDALKVAEAITDDARIVTINMHKRYAAPPHEPGVSFVLRHMVGFDEMAA